MDPGIGTAGPDDLRHLSPGEFQHPRKHLLDLALDGHVRIRLMLPSVISGPVIADAQAVILFF